MIYNSLQCIGNAGKFINQRVGPSAGNHLSISGDIIIIAAHGVSINVEVTANIAFPNLAFL